MDQDRATLPMIPAVGEPEDPTSWLYLDAMHLIKDGLLDPSLVDHISDTTSTRSTGQDAWARIVELMRELGQVGVYRKWLRANGVIHTCPPWCQSAHPTQAIYDPMGVEPLHTADIGRVGRGVAEVTIEASTNEPAEVHVEMGERDLTPRQARQLAALLLDAAEASDKRAVQSGESGGLDS